MSLESRNIEGLIGYSVLRVWQVDAIQSKSRFTKTEYLKGVWAEFCSEDIEFLFRDSDYEYQGARAFGEHCKSNAATDAIDLFLANATNQEEQ